MESEYEYETDEEVGSNDESESEVDEVSVENLPTFSDRITVGEPARTIERPQRSTSAVKRCDGRRCLDPRTPIFTTRDGTERKSEQLCGSRKPSKHEAPIN